MKSSGTPAHPRWYGLARCFGSGATTSAGPTETLTALSTAGLVGCQRCTYSLALNVFGTVFSPRALVGSHIGAPTITERTIEHWMLWLEKVGVERGVIYPPLQSDTWTQSLRYNEPLH